MDNQTSFPCSKYGVANIAVVALLLLASACSPPAALRTPSTGHIGTEPIEPPDATPPVQAEIPPPLIQAPSLPPPDISSVQETYTVIVTDVPIKELLFSLARDAKLNLDIYDDIKGSITINAIDQTLPQILQRIAKQSDIRYQIDGANLVVSADTPYLKTYKIDYVNMSRSSTGQIRLSTQIASTGSMDVSTTTAGAGQSSGANNSTLSVVNVSDNEFWQTLANNIAAIIADSDDGNQAASSRHVMVNREAGLISVRATFKQHNDIQAFVDQVIASAQRQVLIEATVVEVGLDNNYQTGVDWGRFTTNVVNGLPNGVDVEQQLLGGNLGSAPATVITYGDINNNYNISASVRLLEQFGDVQVLSSPKIMVLNNQTSVLKVVDNRVYFTIDVDRTQNQISTLETFQTEVHTVPVGLVMSLVPYISETDEVVLNIRPTISRILQFVNDPNPELARAGVVSPIPEIQVREMESVLRLANGQVAVIGGLMQDSRNNSSDGVPGVSRLPVVGDAFKYRNDQLDKTELVIFIRTTVVKEPSLDGDLKRFREFLPARSAID